MLYCLENWYLRSTQDTEFHKNYKVQKDFERRKSAGVFLSVNPDGSVGERS